MFPESRSLLPRKNVGIFVERGISGGHDDARLHAFIDANPELGYLLVLKGTNVDPRTGIVYRKYDQWMYTGDGPVPGNKARGAHRRPRAGSSDAGSLWKKASEPKTTVSDITNFMDTVEHTFHAWTSNPANFDPTVSEIRKMFSHQLPGGPAIVGYFNYTPPGRFEITTAYVAASWIP